LTNAFAILTRTFIKSQLNFNLSHQQRKNGMNLLQKYLLLICIAVLGLVAGCVTQQSYNQLDGAYSQLQQAYQGDEVEIRKLQGELRVTIKDKILFPEG